MHGRILTQEAAAEALPTIGVPPVSAADCRVAAVIVAFEPDRGQLLDTVDAAVQQAGEVIIVDNGTSELIRTEVRRRHPGVVWRHSGCNLGLAEAQNRGAAEARQRGAEQVLFLDQDSVVLPGMLAEMQRLWGELTAAGVRVGAIGPCYLDPENGCAARFKRQRARPGAAALPADCVEVELLIASGTLVSLDALESVGGMDPTLFIDRIDIDWCHRARAQGFRLFGAERARMHHCLGERRRRIWLLRWYNVALHKPFRYYYIFRNSLLLYRRGSTPRGWIAQDALRLAGVFAVCTLFNAPRRATLSAILRGVADGLRGRGGPLSMP